MSRLFRMTAYELCSDAVIRMQPDTVSAIFARQGEAVVVDERVAEDGAAFALAGEALSTSGCAWLFELGPAEARLRREEGLQPILSRIATAPEGELILRIDRVGSAAGAQTPAHRHRGPGIRRLVSGLLHAEVGGHFDRIGPGQAWFESGREDVVGTNVSGGDNSFVRVMLLPSELAGGVSSFVAASPVDAAKPRAAQIQILGERKI